VANGKLNEAKDFVSKYIKISKFLKKGLILHFLVKNQTAVSIKVAQDISFSSLFQKL
jgi:hypothetical protein